MPSANAPRVGSKHGKQETGGGNHAPAALIAHKR